MLSVLAYLSVCIYVCVGGEGKVGKVVDIRGWDTESGRSVASVTWSNGTTNVYRMGHKGKVDLKYVSDGQGGFYYKDHLPKLGKTVYFISFYSILLCFSPFGTQHGSKVTRWSFNCKYLCNKFISSFRIPGIPQLTYF